MHLRVRSGHRSRFDNTNFDDFSFFNYITKLSTDVECLETMKSNCDKMDLNFDMVYQGSKGYRFVRESNKKHNNEDIKEESDVLRQQRSVDNLPSEHQVYVHLVDEPVAAAAPAPVVGAPAPAAASTDEGYFDN